MSLKECSSGTEMPDILFEGEKMVVNRTRDKIFQLEMKTVVKDVDSVPLTI